MIIQTLNDEGKLFNRISTLKARIVIGGDILTIDIGEDDGDLFIRSPDGRLVITPDASNKIFIKVE